MAKILIAEDDEDIARSLSDCLKFELYTVDVVHDGEEALYRLKNYQYDLAVLDWGLPHVTGVDICIELRKAGNFLPIIMLTGKSTTAEKTAGLDSGADDYLTKPFAPEELSARVRARLRKQAGLTSNSINRSGITVDLATRTVSIQDKNVTLKPKEFALLEFLIRHPDQVHSKNALMERVWPTDSDSALDTIYTTMGTLRKKLNEYCGREVIRTMHGVGYTFVTFDD